MANQNLSQFTEKTFVADADHTFIWDTAASISKRVSRNSWLNSGTLTSDAPVTISQTWNNAAVAFTGLKFNAAGTSGTNSASGSLLADFQLNGVSQASVNKSGNLTVVGYLAANGGNSFLSGTTLRIGNSNGDINLSGGSLIVPSTTAFGWANTLLVRDGADNTLALRNGAVQQMFRVYGTYSDASNYRRLAMGSFNTTEFDIQTEGAGSGVTAGPLNFGTAGVRRMTITTAGNVGIGTTSPSSILTVAQGTAGVGTISVGAAGTTVTGVGTQFLNTFKIGQTITSAGQTLTISAIASDTSMTISPAAGAAISGQAYTLVGGTRFGVAGHGDIEVNTASSGLILKSPDGTRYRVTVPNGGTVLTITAV